MAKYAKESNRCIITANFGAILHHVISRGAGGSDHRHNLLSLSHFLHMEVHSIGLTRFAEKYAVVKQWLEDNDWEFDEIRKKWLAPPECRLKSK